MPYLSTERLADMKKQQQAYFASYRANQTYQTYNYPSDEPAVCHHFGCGVHLSLLESLAGNRCINHSRVLPRPDVTKMVSF